MAIKDARIHLTSHIDAMPEGPQVGAFFDFDGTIINGFSAFVFLREQLLKGYVSSLGFVEIVATLINHSMGSIGFSGLMAVGAKVLKGVSEDEYTRFSDEVYDRFISRLIYPEALALIEAHLEKGHTVAIVSSATPYQVAPFARALSIEHVFCTRYEVSNGEFTGELDGPVCWGEGKVEAVDQLADSYDLDLESSVFYSDSDDDLAVLERVGYPRVVNPNRRLGDVASKRGWPVEIFARTGKPTLGENLRTLGLYGTLVSSYFWGLGVWKLNGSKEEGRRFMLSSFTDIAFALIGVKIKIRNPENYYKAAPVVVIYNHQSMTDGLIMMKLLKDNFAAVGKKEIAKNKLMAKLYDFAGVVTVDRENTHNAIEAMQPLVDALVLEGRNVCIAPEGTRSPSRKPLPFKKGPFHIAMQAGVPILPVVIHNGADVQPKGQFAYRPGIVDVEILEPIDTSHWTKQTLNQHITDVRNRMLLALGFDEEGVAEAVHTKSPKSGSTNTPRRRSSSRKPSRSTANASATSAKGKLQGRKATTGKSTARTRRKG